MKKWISKLKDKWGVSSWGLIAIITSFSLAGSTVVRIKTPILNAILPVHSSPWLRGGTYALLIMPLYQICLVIYGTLLGQFRFFWEKEKKLIAFLKRPFVKLVVR